MTPELTHRQLLSTPRTRARCLCLSSSPACPSGSWKSLEDFVTSASLFTEGALQPPGQQQSSSRAQLTPSHAPLLSPGAVPLGQTWLTQGAAHTPAAKGFTRVEISRFLITFLLNWGWSVQRLKSQQLFIDAVTYLNKLFKHKESKVESYPNLILKEQDHFLLRNTVRAF